MNNVRTFLSRFAEISSHDNFQLTPAQVEGVMDSIYRRGDSMMKLFILLHMLIAIFSASSERFW